MELKGDSVGLLALEHGIDTKKKFGAGVNEETQMLASHGYDMQDKSKQALQRTLAKVHETNKIANDAVMNLEKQNSQILRINDKVQRLESTMTRTRKYLKYFGKSFCSDKTAVCLLILIVLTLVAIIFVSLYFPTPEKSETEEET